LVSFDGRRRSCLINPLLYDLASDPATYADDFFDVTVGDNHVDGDGGFYSASDRLGSDAGPRDAERGEPAARPRRRERLTVGAWIRGLHRGRDAQGVV
jgi:hypothetical protein